MNFTNLSVAGTNSTNTGGLAGNAWSETVGALLSITVPSAPAGLDDNSNYPTSIDLSWYAPDDGGRDITDYVVHYKKHSDSSWITFTHAPTTSSPIVVTGLDSATSYDFQVAANSSFGTGDFSSTAGPAEHNIGSCEQLANINADPHGSFTLEHNIDCSVTNPASQNFNDNIWDESGFVPIDNFASELNGNGHTISSIYMNRPTQ